MSDPKSPNKKIALSGAALIVLGGLSLYVLKARHDSNLRHETAAVGSDGFTIGSNGDAAHRVPSTNTGPSAISDSGSRPSDLANSMGTGLEGNSKEGASSSVAASNGGAPSIGAPAAGTFSTGTTSIEAPTPSGVRGTQIAMIDNSKPLEVKPVALPVVEPDPSCFTVSYTHKTASGHKNMDECSQHRNLIKLTETKLNHKSVCVRVDGTPVKFDWLKSAILLGPVAGPNTKITVRYCQPKAKDSCADDCRLPKDEFMAALGGDEEKIAKNQAKGGKVAKWDPTDAHEDSDVAAQVDTEMQKELADGIDLATFDGWKDSAPVQSCSRDVASAKGPGGQAVSARK